MTTFPNSPRLIKGALVGVDIFNPLASVVVFQYKQEKGPGYFTGVKSLCQERDRKGDSPFGEEGLSSIGRSMSACEER
jgi:hypothetical protein